MERISQLPTLRDELVPTGSSTLPFMEDLKHEQDSLTQEIGRQQDALDTLVRMQRKYVTVLLIAFNRNVFPLCNRPSAFRETGAGSNMNR